MVDAPSPWGLHFAIERQVPQAPQRIGYAALQQAVQVGQRNRVKRAVSTLVALDVLQWEGTQRGRAVAQGSRKLQEALDAGLIPMPEREIQTYPLLTGPLDDFITGWHVKREDPLDTSGGATSFDDGVRTYCTSALRAAGRNQSTAHTRPDLTVVVDLQYEYLGSWNEVHAVEVKPYWAVTRAALFEAAAQAALRRCTFSWLLAWVPEPDTGHFTAPQTALIEAARRALPELAREADSLGLGLLVASNLDDRTQLECRVEPHRQAMDPRVADQLFKSLHRRDGASTVVPTS